MPKTVPPLPLCVAKVNELEPGTTKKFLIVVDGLETECFLVNYEGKYFAYINRCSHVPMTMDWIENQFMTEDGRYILCATHGAAFEPSTGECIFGPPCGKFLVPIKLKVLRGKIYASSPQKSDTN